MCLSTAADCLGLPINRLESIYNTCKTMNLKQPIRTYQRKTVKTVKPFTSSLALSAAVSSKKYDSVEKNFDKSGIYNDSLNCDPFDTTFDRIAKGAVVPPMPLDINQNDPWKGNSSDSDSDVNDVRNVKFLQHTSNLSVHNNTSSASSSTYINNKLGRKCRKRKKYEPEITVSTGILLNKRSRMLSTKNKMQQREAQEKGQKKQTNQIQKKRILKDKCKPNRICNGQVSHVNSNVMDDLKSVPYGVSCDNNHRRLHENVLKIDKNISSTNDSIANFKHVTNYEQIKACFVKLNAYAVQNYILNREKIAENKQDIPYDTKFLSKNTDISQTNKDISKIRDTLQSISSKYNDFGDFKHMTIKQCSIALCNDTVKDWLSKNKRNVEDIIDIEDESTISYLVSHDLSEITPNCDKSIALASYNAKESQRLMKNHFINAKRLKIEEYMEKNTISNKKEQNMVSSTPIGKRVKPSNNLVIFSPIESDIYDKLHWNQEHSLVTAKEISNIDRKDFRSLTTMSKCYKLDPADIHEQQTQVLLLSQKSVRSTDSIVQNEVTSRKRDIHVVTQQRYETEHHVETEIPYVLNMSQSSSTNQSRSLFDDADYYHSTKDTDEDNTKETCFSNTLACKFQEINTVDSSVDLSLEQKRLLSDNEQAVISSRYISPSTKFCTTFRDSNNAMHMRQKYNSEFQVNYDDTRINAIKTIHENLQNETVNVSKLSEDQSNINDASVILAMRLQDSIRIGRRMQFPKWHLSMSNISSLNNDATQSNNETSQCVTTDEDFTNVCIQSAYNFEHSKEAINSYVDSFKDTTQFTNKNEQMEKSLFLKPGKCRARSLSILNNINDKSDLYKLSIGKGKKWRRSVRNILDMQKRGIFQSCLKKGKDDADLSSDGLDKTNISSFNSNKCKASANYARFSKRISVRVVLNDTITECDIKDISFLEAFGIITDKSSDVKLLHKDKSLIHNDGIISNHSTARDVVLQRCSQNCYMPFADRFPDSYLKHCHKIGEGVYGEVFLYEYDGKKSVVKIIPIENEQLVNDEPQKKFSEILSEVVIAKELDNLKLNATYKTSGFVQVKSISCIIGKYPEKLVELWNIYDNDKTSDNDCPSMFGENQLYIALELGHGGEDLETFVFQTAEEAHVLFLQIALALAIAEKALEFEHRDLHWGNVLVLRTEEPYIYYNLDGTEIKFPSKGVKVSIIDFTLSRMLYQGCCIYNDLALDPALFTAHGEYQFEIYRLMRDKIQNNWRKFEPYTNILWLHYILDKMITAVRYKKKNLKIHKHNVVRLKDLKDTILNYDSAYDFVINSNSVIV